MKSFGKVPLLIAAMLFSFAGKALADDVNDLASLIAKQYSPYVAKLNSSVYVYHWGDRKRMGADKLLYIWEIEPNRTETFKYFNAKSASFFNTSLEHSTNAWGKGLYAAENASDSKSYGNGLLKIRLPFATKYLDFRMTTEFPGTILLNHPLYNRVCGKTIPFKRESFDSSASCITALKKAFVKLQVSFIAYHWMGSGAEGIAVNIIQTDNFQLNDVTYLEKDVAAAEMLSSTRPGQKTIAKVLPPELEYFRAVIEPLCEALTRNP